MKLPSAERALVEREKITEYLLNPAHPDNGGKVQFFLALGFRPEVWLEMVKSLNKLALKASVTVCLKSPHGEKYVVDGQIETPGGTTPWIRTVWIIDLGMDAPRLIKPYPFEEREKND